MSSAGRLRVQSVWLRRRFALQAAFDCLLWGVAVVFATLVRYDFAVDEVDWGSTALIIPLAMALQAAFGTAGGNYRGRWQLGSFEEVLALCVTVGATGSLVVVIDAVHRFVPLSSAISAPLVVLVGACGVRWTWRFRMDRRRRPNPTTARRVVVFGAGEGGAQIITSMVRDHRGAFLPVALLDDDPLKRQLRLRGVPVRGSLANLARTAEAVEADMLLVAIPSASSALVRAASEAAAAAGLDVRVLPPVDDLVGAYVDIDDIRPITPADLLGRREIDTDIGSIAQYVTGHRVLVTGAGGSIGSELCRQIYCFGPAELVMLDRDESALHGVQLSIHGRALLDSRDLVVADLRDAERIDEVFAEHRPEVVFHAAALKHLPLLQMHPGEAWKTNVAGTTSILKAAIEHGVARFVNISTDKAADATSVLGTSKRLTERLTAWADCQSTGDFMSVRFGNVLGSRGSVLTSFRTQIEAGGPVTVTHPDVTRYFMTLEESVQLVVQAAAIGSGGDVLVLDMGEPVRIASVAHRLIEEANRPIELVYTGLRPGEKLHEQLFGVDEVATKGPHPLISHVAVPELDPDAAFAAWTESLHHTGVRR